MQTFKNMKISLSILLVATVPIVMALFFAGQLVHQRLDTLHDMDDLAQLANLSVKINNVVHEQQKERGLTVGFISSNGEKQKAELSEQRPITDKAKENFETTLTSINMEKFDSALSDKLKAVKTTAEKIGTTRAAVDNLSIPAAEAAAYYTDLNKKGLDVIGAITHLSKNAEITESLNAYLNFSRGKEQAGIERATGTKGFTEGAFDTTSLKKMASLAATQAAYEAIFLSLASSKHVELYQNLARGENFKEVERLRGIATSGDAAAISAIQGKYWFDTLTQKINDLKKLEDEIAQDLEDTAAEIRHDAMKDVAWEGGEALLGLCATLLLSFVIIKTVNASFKDIVSAMTQLAAGNLNVILPAETRNEIGEMVRALNIFQKNAVERKRLAEQQEQENQAKLARAQRIENLINGFDKEASELLKGLAVAATEMEATSKSMSSIAEETSKQASVVAAASTQAGANVQNVASATEELSASFKDISGQVALSNDRAKLAANTVQGTKKTVEELSESVSKIGEVIDIITDIAEQTNLLALNATIEAARAGDMGRGFAVVASEVKNLASQTSTATDRIAGIIRSVQAGTKESVNGIETTNKIILEINKASTAIAATMEQQTNATMEISRNVQEAAAGTSEVSRSINGVTTAAGESGKAAGEVLSVSQKLAERSTNMQREVETFLQKIRTA